MRFFIFTLSAIILSVFAVDAFAQDSELATKLCEIRQLFCGDAWGGALVTAAVLFLGVLVLNGKVHWTLVVLIVAGMMIFINAEYMPGNLTTQTVELDDECYCD